MNSTNNFFATCSKGVEDLVKNELEQLQIPGIKLHTGGVSFTGSLEGAYKACLWSRVASRILLQLKDFEIDSDDDLYDEIFAIDWSTHFSEDHTLAIDCFSSHSIVNNSHFATLRVKDAIVDQFVEQTGLRPSISKDCPDIRLNVYLSDQKCLLYFDLSGEALHKRGYRQAAGIAPLRETLAASMLYRAKWSTFFEKGLPFFDPMCGSGTLLIEAAMMAADIAPGLLRESFGFTHWKQFESQQWQIILDDARHKRTTGLQSLPPIYGSDNSETTVAIASKNIAAADLSSVIKVSVKDATANLIPENPAPKNQSQRKLLQENPWLKKAEPNKPEPNKPEPNKPLPDNFDESKTSEEVVTDSAAKNEEEPLGLIVTNPPYGKRIGQIQLLRTVYYRFGKQLKTHFNGWTVVIITSEQELAKSLGLRAFRKNTLYNGAIKSTLYQYRVNAFTRNNNDRTNINDSPDNTDSTKSEKQMQWPNAKISASEDSQAVSATEHTAEHRTEHATMFINRLKKNHRHLKKWARKNTISCYRVYDADIPQYAVAIDIYDKWVHVQEYQAPKSIDKNKAFQRINDVIDVVADVLETEQEFVVLKVRKRQEGTSQYQKQDQKKRKISVRENNLKFLINVYDYIDTGLFLDHRITRQLIKKLASKRSFLNLFAYTGSVSVYAAAGNARTTTTIDMSNTYLDWARDNMSINGYTNNRHTFIRADCLDWISQAIADKQKYQLIFVDPPTFSNSKKMSTVLDIKRDHAALLSGCLALLADDGQIIFSTNAKGFKLDAAVSEECFIKEITAMTTTEDFRRKPQHRCWCLAKQEAALAI